MVKTISDLVGFSVLNKIYLDKTPGILNANSLHVLYKTKRLK